MLGSAPLAGLQPRGSGPAEFEAPCGNALDPWLVRHGPPTAWRCLQLASKNPEPEMKVSSQVALYTT